METFLTRTLTIVAVGCLLVAGGAVAAILGIDSLPKAQFQLAAAPEAPPTAAAAKPKAVAKPQPPPQKNYALLSDAQIAGIKDRLKLSASQESYWPAVETALRGVARKIHASRQANPNVQGVQIDPDSAEVQQLKSAAMPLLFQLREDQKNEVRSLARIIGLDKVASMI
jgi:ABC-type transporter Mla MlaB component